MSSVTARTDLKGIAFSNAWRNEPTGTVLAIVDLGGGADGMIHVSELKQGFVKQVEDVVHLGDHVHAKIIKAENGKIGLSLKQMEA